MINTALGADIQKEYKIIFKNLEHKKFYFTYLLNNHDTNHKALFYCLGLSNETRQNIKNIYDFDTECIKPECLSAGWQTSNTRRIIRISFNLYCDCIPTMYNYENEEDQINEIQHYSISDIFCSVDARYFWEAIKVRYPDYCYYVEQEGFYNAEN